jgi:hypothetical protein
MAKVGILNEENKRKRKSTLRIDQETLKKRFIEVHGSCYDYSNLIFKGSKEKVEITCKRHGAFWQNHNAHLNGAGCPACARLRTTESVKINQETAISNLVAKHGDRYDYSDVVYRGAMHPIDIICKIHGPFSQVYSNHLSGRNCGKCANKSRANNKTLDTETFIKKAQKVHGNKFCYDKVDYKGWRDKVSILCNNCRCYFEQEPNSHLNGKGCRECGIKARVEKSTSNTEDFIKKAKQIHGKKFCYKITNYSKAITRVCIFCNTCGKTFKQQPSVHLAGCGCPHCGKLVSSEKRSSDVGEFIQKARSIHGDSFCYKKTVYKTAIIKVDIFCNKCKNIFQQSPNSHLSGIGCPRCNESKGENKISKYLAGRVSFEPQKSFKNCKTVSSLRFDFWIPSLNTCIEYQGHLHYTPVDYFGGEKTLIKQRSRDQRKVNFCIKNNIKLIIISYWDFDNIEQILKRELKNTKKPTAQLQIF